MDKSLMASFLTYDVHFVCTQKALAMHLVYRCYTATERPV